MSGETVVLESGHVDLYPAEINLSLGNKQVEIRYEKTLLGLKLASVRVEVSFSDLKALAEHLAMKVQESELESVVTDGIVQYAALTEKGRMFMSGVMHGSR